MITKKEYMKIFDYILENHLDLIDGYYISNDYLLQIRNYIKGKRIDDSFMQTTHEQLIINHFLKHGNNFNEETPMIIINNEKCFNKSIHNDINSIDYAKDSSINIELFVDFIIKNNYIISINSPIILRKNYDVIISSIKNDYLSADYVIYEDLSENEKQLIVEELLKTDYCLNSNSHEYLRNNKSIILHSIQKDVTSYEYSLINFCQDYDIFITLISNKYEFNGNEDYKYINLLPLSFIKSSDILNKIFELLDLYYYDDNNYQKLFSKLYFTLLSNYPTIKSFDNIINYLCDTGWSAYRNNNLDMLSNIYSKIISIIKRNENYESFYHEFVQLGNQMANVIGDKYDILINSIKEFYNNPESPLANYTLIISRISALFISMKKEEYKKDIKDSFYDYIKDFYILKLDNKIVNKKILHYIKKEIFITKYNNNDKIIKQFINCLTTEYIDLYGEWIKKPIDRFLNKEYTKINYIIKSPNNYQDYSRYIEAIKLINRLNSGYLKYNDQELTNYRDIIIFDRTSSKYIYSGKMSFDITKCKEYYNKEIIFQKFIKEIMLYINTIEIDDETYNEYLDIIFQKRVIGDLPFTDEYYKFNPEILNNYNLGKFINSCISKSRPLCEIESFDYNTIYEILSNNNLIWLWTLDSCIDINRQLYNQNININNLIEIFNNLEKIKYLSNYLNINYYNYGNLSLLNDLSKYSDSTIINLIRPEIIKILCSKTDYTAGYGKKQIMKVAGDLICQMAKRTQSTVPYINGYLNGYHYTMYDSLEDDVLTTGPDVDSCLKVCGNDNDFLHYCMCDKNGFIIKITNHNNNLIGRAAGFRSGNIIYINQLRTIYDVGGTGYRSRFKSEKDEIIEVLTKACQDMVELSQKSDEDIKIDYVFITQSYAFEKHKVDKKISNKIKSLIGKYPIDITTEDWKYFVKNTHNIFDSKEELSFSTDYSEYNLICLASSKEISCNINKNDICICDVEAIYKRPRNKITVTNNISNEIIKKIIKIRTIYNYYHKDIKYPNINNNDIVILGDNWYLIYNDKIIDYCIQDFDEIAKYEYNEISKLLLEYKDENQLQEKIKLLK